VGQTDDDCVRKCAPAPVQLVVVVVAPVVRKCAVMAAESIVAVDVALPEYIVVEVGVVVQFGCIVAEVDAEQFEYIVAGADGYIVVGGGVVYFELVVAEAVQCIVAVELLLGVVAVVEMPQHTAAAAVALVGRVCGTTDVVVRQQRVVSRIVRETPATNEY